MRMDAPPTFECSVAESFFSGEILDLIYAGYIYNYLAQNSDRYYDELMYQFKIVCTNKKYLSFLGKKRESIKK